MRIEIITRVSFNSGQILEFLPKKKKSLIFLIKRIKKIDQYFQNSIDHLRERMIDSRPNKYILQNRSWRVRNIENLMRVLGS